MEVLNAAGARPISVLSDRKAEPRRISTSSLPAVSLNFKFNLPQFSLPGGLSLLSAVFCTGFARALTYEEALQQSANSLPSIDFDVNGFLDNVVSFGTENPLVIAGGAAAVALPLVLSQVLGNSKAWGVESAKKAYAKLADDADAQLLDIRAPAELRKVGSPDIRGLKKKPVSVPYKGQDKPGFLKKLALKFKEPENTTLFILDKFDGNSELVADLTTANGFKAAYAIKDGAEGSRGWMNSGLPWILPQKGLSFDLSSLTNAIDSAIGDDGLPLTLGIIAATGIGVLAFSEVETILELLGSAVFIQFFAKKFLFAEDRKKTLRQLDEYLNTKIAPQELVDDVKEIGKALLPPSSTKALPARAEASPSVADGSAQEPEAVPVVEAAAEPSPEVNSVPNADIKAESFPGISRPLSPYPNYPDLKPPSSPRPSPP